MRIFFDFDGTLIDSRMRLYQLFQHLVPSSTFTFDQYWALKRDKINHAQILKNYLSFGNEEIKHFEIEWLEQIEQDQWLQYDKPLEGVHAFLESLAFLKVELFLVTARQSKAAVVRQLKNFQWASLFEEVLVTEQRTDKAQLMLPYVTSKEDWMIGDTGADVQEGKKVGIKTAAVLTGFRTQEVLESYQPDMILTDVTKFSIKL